MCWLIFTALCIAAHVISLRAHPASLEGQDETRVLIGRLLRVDPETGEHHSLLRQELQTLPKNRDRHLLRIRFDEDAWSPIDMRVTHGSVWASDSKVEIVDGSDSIPVPKTVDGGCVLRGKLLNVGGTVIINKCDASMTGHIHTDHHTYEMEEHETSEGQGHQQDVKFKITRNRHEIVEMEEEYDEMARNLVNQEVAKKMTESQNNGTLRSKRDVSRLDIELAIYLDRNYLVFLFHAKGLKTWTDVERHMVAKWETVQEVLNDPVEVGAEVNIQLKNIIYWTTNPTGYPADNVGLRHRRNWFCQNTNETDHYDIKVLYTKGVGVGEAHVLGVAYIRGVCEDNRNCFVVKPSGDRHVWYELHEMGHNLGFPHDPDFGDCEEPTGFMAWTFTYRYLACYKRRLQRQLRNGNLDCLLEQNVNREAMRL